MADYAAAVERAQSRAAVLQSLQAAYGSGKASSSATKSNTTNNSAKNSSSSQSNKKGPTNNAPTTENTGTTVNNSDKGVVNEMVDILMSALGDQTMKSKQFFKDSLRGKAIVVENVKAQLDASKASKRIELAGKRKQSISNRALKRLKIASPTALPPDTEIRMLHDLWWEYAIQLISNCHSEAQLQARLYSMEYVGARAYVLDSLDASIVGTVGIITAVSKNCFFLAVDIDRAVAETDNSGHSRGSSSGSAKSTANKSNTTTIPVPKSGANNTPTATITATPTALTLVKDTTTIGVVLPSLHSKHKSTTPPHTSHTPHTLFADDAEVSANTAMNSGTSGSSGVNMDGNNTTSSSSNVGFKFDHNEREGGGRICVLYGKHFMPHCKYD